MENREIIHACTQVNFRYMRLPAGHVSGYPHLVEVYQNIASQSLECADAFDRRGPCPKHVPAVDAFWWGVLSWAQAFGASVQLDEREWRDKFIAPHMEFAFYLKQDGTCDPINPEYGNAAAVILKLDAAWMELVIRLTGKWGWWSHLKDVPALAEAKSLGSELNQRGSPAYCAYLKSDLTFFNQLFKNFDFSASTNTRLRAFLNEAARSL